MLRMRLPLAILAVCACVGVILTAHASAQPVPAIVAASASDALPASVPAVAAVTFMSVADAEVSRQPIAARADYADILHAGTMPTATALEVAVDRSWRTYTS